MEALAKAVSGLLIRGGWFWGLVVLETLVMTGFWLAGPTPFAGAFDRRAAEADLLLLTLTSLPALFAGALLASGDREDGMADFFRSCRVSPVRQAAGTFLGLFAVTGGALAVSLPLSLAVGAPVVLASLSPWTSLALGLWSVAVHGIWGLALGSAGRSRWTAVVGALGFWVVTVFALEALVTALVGSIPARWTYPVLYTFIGLDPSELVRVVSVTVRGQGWAYGPAFAEARDWAGTGPGIMTLAILGLGHLALPGYLTARGSR